MKCLGVGAVPIRREWVTGSGGVRRADTDICPVCGRQGIAPRKDGRVRVHQAPKRAPRPSLVGQLDEHLQREPRPRTRVVTQK